jgi:hypothetical protein
MLILILGSRSTKTQAFGSLFTDKMETHFFIKQSLKLCLEMLFALP